MTYQPGRVSTGPFKFLTVANGAGRANLRAETAVHTLADIDIKLTKGALFCFLVHFYADRDTDDRAHPLAGKAPRTDIHIDFQNSAVSQWECLLNLLRYTVRILDGHWTAYKVGKGDSHPFKNCDHSVLNVLKILDRCVHRLPLLRSNIWF